MTEPPEALPEPVPPVRVPVTPPVTEDARDAVAAALRAARTALLTGPAPSPLPDARFTAVGRIEWLLDSLMRGEGDVAWYMAGRRDAEKAVDADPDAPLSVAHVQSTCTDPETYARIWNTGLDVAHAQVLGDPARAEEWLAERLEAARAEVRAEPVVMDLSPFKAVLDEIERRMRATGGGVQDAYHNAASLLKHAFRQYDKMPDADPRSVAP